MFKPSATSWSRRINNQWDTAGIKDTSGYGTVTSHCELLHSLLQTLTTPVYCTACAHAPSCVHLTYWSTRCPLGAYCLRAIRCRLTAIMSDGMHIVAWHVPLAISGQRTELDKASLSFAPKVKTPFVLPIFMPGVLGTLNVTTGGQITVALTVGELSLEVLAVGASAAPVEADGRIRLAVGKPVTWQGGML